MPTLRSQARKEKTSFAFAEGQVYSETGRPMRRARLMNNAGSMQGAAPIVTTESNIPEDMKNWKTATYKGYLTSPTPSPSAEGSAVQIKEEDSDDDHDRSRSHTLGREETVEYAKRREGRMIINRDTIPMNLDAAPVHSGINENLATMVLGERETTADVQDTIMSDIDIALGHSAEWTEKMIISKTIAGNRMWYEGLREHIENLPYPINKEDLASNLPSCEYEGCSTHNLPSQGLSLDQLLEYSTSPQAYDITQNHYNRGLMICSNHLNTVPSENLPNTRLARIDACDHIIKYDDWILSDEEQQNFTMSEPGTQNLICDIPIPIYEELKSNGQYHEIGLYWNQSTADKKSKHYCSVVAYMEDSRNTFVE
ncbi:uncharacterized protein L201_006480 [Kwoniella dendrophila CBS 6074]|uniref:SCP domain-containing protein n=1 Tax=Kwoniella dendrophila CBS 6074 TaxID=1295534 RepID=A0AAX4K2Y3_9TREE